MSAPRVAVLRFPGTLDHESAARAVQGAGAEAVLTHHEDTALPDGTVAVVIPGGFSYGDHLRPGALASRTPIMGAVKAHASSGGRVLGICNGFQILCESGLLPGVLRPNASLSFICRQADLEVADSGTPWTGGRAEGEVLSIPFKHHDGAWFGDPGSTRVVLRYKGENPNGSIDKIAGITNLAGNVMGLMPHPEEAQDPLLGSVDGRALFAALVA
ncbi:MAG: phosphoribosylformylglycinamidine synthase subunit PurQ [Actinobacteria bacterium]|nr:phosphoribosylformylglycinamidine synthase subunit PurQ [Actinomycetota bacterium]MBM3697440.1 phosphoribosylformylglycinamidine synthase subunit PurQ [Actinomycetota bacterium]